jgi:hypothetical protein
MHYTFSAIRIGADVIRANEVTPARPSEEYDWAWFDRFEIAVRNRAETEYGDTATAYNIGRDACDVYRQIFRAEFWPTDATATPA